MFYKRVGPSYPKSRLAAPIGQRVDVFVDPSVAEQVYVEDCHVCCRPILLSVRVNTDDEVAIEARQENGAIRPVRKRVYTGKCDTASPSDVLAKTCYCRSGALC